MSRQRRSANQSSSTSTGKAGPAQAPEQDDLSALQETAGNDVVAELTAGSGQAQGAPGAPAAPPADDGADDAFPFQREMEALFGADFSGVKVKTDAASDLGGLNAKAYATGEEIHLPAGADRRLVAEELTHIVQIRQSGMGSEEVSAPDDAHEQEAARVGEQVASGRAAGSITQKPTAKKSRFFWGKPKAKTPPASAGEARKRILDATAGWGTDNEEVWYVVENSGPAILQALGADAAVIQAIQGDMSGSTLERALKPLRPYMGGSTLGGAGAKAVDINAADSVRERVRAATHAGLFSGDIDTFMDIVSPLPLSARSALGHDAEVLGWIKAAYGGANLDKALALVMPEGTLKQAGVGPIPTADIAQLMGQLKSTKGYLDDDEDQMLMYVAAFGQKHPGQAYAPELQQVRDWLMGELSAGQYTTAMQSLNTGARLLTKDDDATQAKQEEELKGQQAVWDREPLVLAEGAVLLRNLRSRKGVFNDDEAKMIEDVNAFADKVGPVPYPWAYIPDVMRFLSSELSSAEYNQAQNTILTGNKRTLQQRIEEKVTHGIFGQSEDESGMITEVTSFIGEIEAAQKAAEKDPNNAEAQKKLADLRKELTDLAADTAFDAKLKSWLSDDEYLRIKALMSSGDLSGDEAKAWDGLLAEVYSSTMWIGDDTVFQKLQELPPSKLVELRLDNKLRTDIEKGLDDASAVQRFHALIGYVAGQDEAALAAVTDPADRKALQEKMVTDLAADKARVVERIEQAGSYTFDWDEDTILKAVMDFQKAGGSLNPAEANDAALLARAGRVFDVAIQNDKGDTEYRTRGGYAELKKRVLDGLQGVRALTMEDRLFTAVDGAGTDDTALEAILKDIDDAELVLKWSNLDEYKSRWDAASSHTDAAQGAADLKALAGFMPDIKDSIMSLIRGDRDDWVRLRGDLRDRLVAALKRPSIAEEAKRTFNWQPTPEILLMLQYVNAGDLHEHNKSGWGGFCAYVSRAPLMGWVSYLSSDTYTARDEEEGFKFDQFQSDTNVALNTGLTGDAKTQAIGTAETSYGAYKTANEELKKVRAAAAAVASAIAGIIVATVFTIATGGAGAGPMVAMLGAMLEVGAQELTKLAILGNDYSVEEGAMNFATSLVTTGLGLGLDKIAEPLTEAINGSKVMQGITGSLDDTFKARGVKGIGKWVTAGTGTLVETAVKEIPSEWVKNAMETEGFLRQEWAGALQVTQDKFKEAGQSMLINLATTTLLNRDDEIMKAKLDGNEGGLKTELRLQEAKKLVIKTTLSQVLAGKPMDATSIAKAVAAAVQIPGDTSEAAEKGVKEAPRSVTWFNNATKSDLMEIPYMTDVVAEQILTKRASGSFTTLADIGVIPSFRTQVLVKAAADKQKEIEDEEAEEKKKQAANATPATTTPTPKQ